MEVKSMALIKCPECNGQVSDKAEVCIHCGYPLKKIAQKNNRNIKKPIKKTTIEENKKVQENIKNEIIKALEKSENAIYSRDIAKMVSESITENVDEEIIEQNLAVLCKENKVKVAFDGCLKYEIACPIEDIKLSVLGTEIHSNDINFSQKTRVNDLSNQNSEKCPKLVKCPKCGSTQIQMVPRKWSLFTGFMTNKVDRVCVNCKCKF